MRISGRSGKRRDGHGAAVGAGPQGCGTGPAPWRISARVTIDGGHGGRGQDRQEPEQAIPLEPEQLGAPGGRGRDPEMMRTTGRGRPAAGCRRSRAGPACGAPARSTARWTGIAGSGARPSGHTAPARPPRPSPALATRASTALLLRPILAAARPRAGRISRLGADPTPGRVDRRLDCTRSAPSSTRGMPRHRRIAAQEADTGITPSHGRNLADETHGGDSLGEGRADRSAPTEAMASRQGRRGAGFLEPILTPPDRRVNGAAGGIRTIPPVAMASGRLELPRPLGHRLLRPTRLPFRHEAVSGIAVGWVNPPMPACSLGGFHPPYRASCAAGRCSLRSDAILIDRPEHCQGVRHDDASSTIPGRMRAGPGGSPGRRGRAGRAAAARRRGGPRDHGRRRDHRRRPGRLRRGAGRPCGPGGPWS